jgi:hypothetical protein
MRELHLCLGHIAPTAIKELIRRGVIVGVELKEDDIPFECPACIKAKSMRAPISKVRERDRASMFGKEVHSDLWGKSRKATLGGRRYYNSYTDDYS